MMFWDPDGLAVIYLGDGRVKIEALDIYGVLQVLYLPQEHWIKLVTGQAGGYGPYTGENFLLREGTPDLNTAQGRAEYKARANAVLENFFGPGTEITASHSDTNKVIVSTVVNGSLLAIGLPAGASSGFAIVRGLSYTAEAGLSGYAIYDGSGNIYEGIQDGNAGQVVWGTLETAAGALGGYGSVRALTGEIRAGLGSGALVVDDALLNAHVAESLGPVAQRNRLAVQNNGANPYAGVKEASTYLQQMGVSRADRVQILQSFNVGTISVETAGNSTFGLRFHDFGTTARPMGQYLMDTFTPLTNRANLALPSQWNRMTGVSQWQIKPGTTYLSGQVGAQLGYGPQFVGGAKQFFVLTPWKYGTLISP